MKFKTPKSTLFIILFYALFLNSCSIGKQVTRNGTWELAYQNDKNGDAVSGTVDQLIYAINQGQEVRIMIINEDSRLIAEAENIWIKNGIVHAQNTNHISVEYQGDELHFKQDAYHWYYTINTNGDLIISRWSLGEHRRKGSSTKKVAAKWFVK